MFDVCVSCTAPFQACAQNGIKVTAREVKCCERLLRRIIHCQYELTFDQLPATTSDVPTKLSKIFEYFGDDSASAFDTNLHIKVAKPSMIAPANGET